MGFYCENCGREVKRNSDSCPSCGVLFKAVKCPSCGFIDKADFFKGGCPSCGYLSLEDKKISMDELKVVKERKPVLSFIPPSVFWVSGIALLILLIMVMYRYLQ